ncbi:MAG: glycosyltransferase family 2 protein [Candidatus Vogelbacteria bacterium]|nr:glycosyltransferase family 2 protein [Candidatus Vogelbacteria bacterium]
MNITAILRIKDEALIIKECLAKLSGLVDQIVILDNGSTDGTSDIYKEFPKITKILHTVGYDEGRDKIMLLEEAKNLKSDWILWIDGDEVFEDHLTRDVLDKYINSGYDRVTFRMCNFWLNRELCRYDGNYYLYTLHPQRSMWRNSGLEYFKNQKMHNGDIQGDFKKIYLSPYRIKHYGYSFRSKAEQKYRNYLKEDPNSTRDYTILSNPDYPAKTFKFVEFDNRSINYFYVLFYKYLCGFLWVTLRVRFKLSKILGLN